MEYTTERFNADCLERRQLATNFFYILPQILSICSSISSVVIFVCSFLKYGFQLLYHHNSKVLMILHVLFCVIFSIDILILSTLQVFNALTYKNDCDVVYKTSFCSIFRRIALTSFVGVTTTQFCQTIERVIATIFKQKYGTQVYWLGQLLSLFSILSAILIIEWTLWNENPSEEMTHCLTYSASISIGERMFIVLSGILFVDIIIFATVCFLYRNNMQNALTARLRFKYQQKENLAVLRAFFPMVILNTIFVSSYILIAIIGRSFRNMMSLGTYKLFAINAFIIPHVSFLLSVTIYLNSKREFERRSRRIRELNKNGNKVNTQVYFRMIESQWNKTTMTRKET